MSGPPNFSSSEGPPHAPPDEEPIWSSDAGGPALADHDLELHGHNPPTGPQPDAPMPSETTDLDVLSFMDELTHSTPYFDDHNDWIDPFVRRLCLRLLDSHSADKRDALVSADTAANVDLAGFVFEAEGDLYGDMRGPLIGRFREYIQLTMHAFRQWWYCWTTGPMHHLPSEEAARALSEEAASHNPVGWVKALISVFGHVPELWDLPSSVATPNLGSPSLEAPTFRDKGKGVDRSNMGPSDFQSAWLGHDITQSVFGDDSNTMDVFQTSPSAISGPPAASQPQSQVNLASGYEAPRSIEVSDGLELQFIHYHGPVDPEAPVQSSQDIHPSAGATTGDPTQSMPGGPDLLTSGGPFPATAPGTFDQRPSPSFFPHLSSGDRAAGGHTQPSVKIGPFEFSALARALGTTEELHLPNATSTRAFEEATAHLRSAWGGSSHSLPLTSGSTRNSAAEWRDQARRLVQEYKEVKEAQIAKLEEAVLYLRGWHSLYLEVEYRLYRQGIQVSPEFQVQAARMFVFTNLLTLLVIHRRHQLGNLE